MKWEQFSESKENGIRLIHSIDQNWTQIFFVSQQLETVSSASFSSHSSQELFAHSISQHHIHFSVGLRKLSQIKKQFDWQRISNI